MVPGPTLGLQESERGSLGDEASSLVGSGPGIRRCQVLLADGACQGWRGRSRDRAATVQGGRLGGAWLHPVSQRQHPYCLGYFTLPQNSWGRALLSRYVYLSVGVSF